MFPKSYVSKKAQNDTELREIIEDLSEILEDSPNENLGRAFVKCLKAYCKNIFKNSVDLKNFDEIKSLDEVRAMLADSITQMKEEYLQKGFMLGEEKGIEKGIDIGFIQGIQFILKKQLYSRFGDIPQYIIEKIEKTNNIDELQKILDNISTISSVEDFK